MPTDLIKMVCSICDDEFECHFEFELHRRSHGLQYVDHLRKLQNKNKILLNSANRDKQLVKNGPNQ
jgi:hypothetical protein